MKGKKLTKDVFICRCEKKHNNKYGYSLVDYVNSHTKIKIICPIHGEFEQRPHRHLIGDGCKECSKLTIAKKNSATKEEFIAKSKMIHNDKYDYIKVKYVNNKVKVEIICPIHGEFWQNPTSHLSMKSGCSECGKNKKNINNTKTLEEFIKQARMIHGLKYDYSNVVYDNTDIKIQISCPKHGVFHQKPTKHLQNQGCPVCKESKLEKLMRNFLITNKINFIQQYGKKNGGGWLGMKSLDFFLPEINLGIECQGEQHFKPVDFGNKGTEIATKQFNINFKRDKNKYDESIKNGVNIFYFTDKIECINGPYFDIVHTDLNDLINYIKIYKNE